MINVLIVDDSRTAREKLAYDLARAGDLHVCAVARDGEEGVRLALERKPDVVLMDLVMPGMDGCDATRAIMAARPVPVIVMTSEKGREATERVFESGAVEFLSKGTSAEALLDAIRTMSKVKVVGLRVRDRRARAPSRSEPDAARPAAYEHRPSRPDTSRGAPLGVVAIGASTGGPQALQTLLSGIPADLPLSYAIVLHIARGFFGALSGWLSATAGPTIHIANRGERMVAGAAYFAPDDRHLEVGAGWILNLSDAPPRSMLRPSVDVLFESVARNVGRRALGLLMTGMGADGARGLLEMRRAGAMTVTQDEASSVVYGMPAAAVDIGASTVQFNPVAAAAAIRVWAHQLTPATPS